MEIEPFHEDCRDRDETDTQISPLQWNAVQMSTATHQDPSECTVPNRSRSDDLARRDEGAENADGGDGSHILKQNDIARPSQNTVSSPLTSPQPQLTSASHADFPVCSPGDFVGTCRMSPPKTDVPVFQHGDSESSITEETVDWGAGSEDEDEDKNPVRPTSLVTNFLSCQQRRDPSRQVSTRPPKWSRWTELVQTAFMSLLGVLLLSAGSRQNVPRSRRQGLLRGSREGARNIQFFVCTRSCSISGVSCSRLPQSCVREGCGFVSLQPRATSSGPRARFASSDPSTQDSCSLTEMWTWP